MQKIYSLLVSLALAGGMQLHAETIQYSFPHVAWSDVVSSQGWWQFNGYSAKKESYINVSPNYTDHLDGTYTVADMYYAKMYVIDEMAEDGSKTVQFVSGSFTLTTSPYEAVMQVDCDADDGNHYLCDVHGFPHYTYRVIGDGAALGKWDTKQAVYMHTLSESVNGMYDIHTDYVYRVLEPGSHDLKVMINEESMKDAIDGSRLNAEECSPGYVEGGEETDPVTITVEERSFVMIVVYENMIYVKVADDTPQRAYYGVKSISLSFDNEYDAFASGIVEWSGKDVTMNNKTYKAGAMKCWAWDETEKAYMAAETPAVGTECILLYNPYNYYVEVLYGANISGIENVRAEADVPARLLLRDGELTITRAGQSYSVAGVRK